MTRFFQFLTLAAILTVSANGARAASEVAPSSSPIEVAAFQQVAKTTVKAPVVVAPAESEITDKDDKAKPAPTPKPKPKPGPRDDGDGD